jgi:6-phosphofructokinase 1
VVLVSEGATMRGQAGMAFEGEETDQYGHRKLGGIGDRVAALLKERSPEFNNGRRINVVNQRLGYLVRSGDPDALDSIVPMAFGNLALDSILEGRTGRLVGLRNGRYDAVPIDAISGRSKVVDLERYYSPDRLRPLYKTFSQQPLFFMTGDA